MKIRYAKKNEKEIAIKHWRNSFKDSEDEIKFYFENIFDNKNYLVLEKDGEIVSSLHENPYILNFNNNEIKTKYIVGVSTDIKEQRKGYMATLMKEMFKNLQIKNYPFVFLTPINPNIYRKYGFEYFSKIENLKFSIEELESFSFSKDNEFIEVNFENKDKYLKDLIKVYSSAMKENFCFLKRDTHYFDKLLLECFNDGMKIFLMYNKKEVKAYMIFSKYDEKIEIRESFSVDYKSQEEIFAILYGYRDYYKKISLFCSKDSNIEYLFENQLKIEKKEIPFMMLRILNPLKVLQLSDINLKNLKIYVVDDILEANTAVYSYKNEWEKIFTNDYTFKINIRDLSALLTGFFSFDELLFMKKIKLKTKNKAEIKEISEIFKRKKSYLYEFQ